MAKKVEKKEGGHPFTRCSKTPPSLSKPYSKERVLLPTEIQVFNLK